MKIFVTDPQGRIQKIQKIQKEGAEEIDDAV